MVTLDLADTLEIDDPARAGDGPASRWRRRGRPTRWPGTRTRSDRPRTTWWSGRWRRRADGRRAAGQADPARRRPGGRVRRRRRRAAVGRVHRPGRGRRPRGRRPLLPGRGPGPGQRDRRGGGAAALRGADVPARAAALRRGHGGRLPRLRPAGRAAGVTGPGRRATTSRRRPWRWSPAWRAWRHALEEATGRPARLAGSGSTWFVEGEVDGVDPGAEAWLEQEGELAPLVVARTVPAPT